MLQLYGWLIVLIILPQYTAAQLPVLMPKDSGIVSRGKLALQSDVNAVFPRFEATEKSNEAL